MAVITIICWIIAISMIMTIISNNVYNKSLLESDCVVIDTRVVKDEFCHSQECFDGFLTLVLYGGDMTTTNTTVTYCVFTNKSPDDAKHAIAQYAVGDEMKCYYEKSNVYAIYFHGREQKIPIAVGVVTIVGGTVSCVILVAYAYKIYVRNRGVVDVL